MSARFWLFSFVFSMMVLTSCRRQEETVSQVNSAVPESAIAQVGEVWLLEEDLTLKLAQRKGLTREQALDELVQEEAFAQAGEYEKSLDQATLRSVRRRLLASGYLEGRQKKVEPTEELLREQWLSEEELWQVPAQARVAVLKLRDEEGAAAKLREARESFLALPSDPQRRGFGPLAIAFSEEPNTRYQGGSLGWVREGEAHVLLPKEILKAVFSRSGLGLLDEELSADGGLWLVLVVERKPKEKRGFEECRPQLERAWRAHAERSAKESAMESAMSRVSIQRLQGTSQQEKSPNSAPEAPPQFPEG